MPACTPAGHLALLKVNEGQIEAAGGQEGGGQLANLKHQLSYLVYLAEGVLGPGRGYPRPGGKNPSVQSRLKLQPGPFVLPCCRMMSTANPFGFI